MKVHLEYLIKFDLEFSEEAVKLAEEESGKKCSVENLSEEMLYMLNEVIEEEIPFEAKIEPIHLGES